MSPKTIDAAFSEIVAGFDSKPTQQESATLSAAILKASKKIGASVLDTQIADVIYRRTTNPDTDDPAYGYYGRERFDIAIYDLACKQAGFLPDRHTIAAFEKDIQSGAGVLAMRALRSEFPATFTTRA